ncbi:MAG: WD40 repeat domain-containing protein, partial [Bacteroidia bacterium]
MKRSILLFAFIFILNTLSAQRPDVVLTAGHTDQVNCMDINNEGNLLATGGNDKLIKIWDVATGKEIRTLAGNDGRIQYVRFSPDGKYIGAVLYSNQLKFWEVKTGNLVRTIENSSTHDVFDFYPGSESVIYQAEGSKIKISNFVKGTDDKELNVEFATRIRVHPDNKRLLVYTVKGDVRSYSLPGGQELTRLNMYSSTPVPQVSAKMEISHDGKYLAIAFYNNTIHIIDIAANKEYTVFKDHPATNNVIVDIKFKETENKLVSVDAVKNVFVFDISAKKKILGVSNTMFSPICVEVHPKQDYFLVNDMKKVDYCKFSTGEIVKEYQNRGNRLLNMTYDQQGKYLATAGSDISIKLWNLSENKIERTIPGFFPLIFTNDGKKLITMYNSIGLATWNPETGEKLQDINTEYELIQNLSVSADGKYLAGGGFMSIVKVWDLESGKLIKKFTGHTGGIYATAFSPDGKYLASCGLDQTIKIWDFNSGKEIKTLEGHTILVSDVQFSKDGKWLVSGAWDKTVKVWNTQTWTLDKTLEGHVNIVTDIDITDDGKYIVSGSGNNVVSPADNSARIWELATGKQVCKLDNPTGQLNKVIFEKGGDLLFTCGEDGIAKIWNYKDCKEVAGLIAANGTDYMMYTPDNYYICSRGALDAVSFRVD